MATKVVGACFRLVEKIGEGGMGEVYRGVDVNLEREVAIKIIRPELASRAEILQRFRKEAVVLARLNHPNIATLYNFIRDGENYLMIMEFAPGRTLDMIIADQAHGLPWRYACELFIDVLRAIEHAHRHGIIHRDIKPANLMVSERDTVKVLDFGIARVLGEAGLTRVGALIGTTRYMSPEQVQGRPIDFRSDIYSLGTVLYKMLTGRIPFEALTDYEFMKAQIEQRPRPVRELVAEVPQALEAVLMRALEKDPSHRFQTTSELIARMTPLLLEGSAGPRRHSAPSMGATGRPQRRPGPHKAVIALEEGNLARREPDPPTSGSLDGISEPAGPELRPYRLDVIPTPRAALEPPLSPLPMQPPGLDVSPSNPRTPAPPRPAATVLALALLGPRAFQEPDVDAPAAGRPAPARQGLRTPDAAETADPRTGHPHPATRIAWRTARAAAGTLAAALLLGGAWLGWKGLAVPRLDSPVDSPERPTPAAQDTGTLAIADAAPEAAAPPDAASPEPDVGEPKPAADIDALITSAERHLRADRLLAPPGANALEAFQAALRSAPDHQAAREGKERIVQRLIELARLSAQRGSWQQAEDYLEQGLRVSAGSEELRLERQALRDRQMKAERKRISAEAQRAEQRRLYERLVALTREAMGAADWNRAETYLEQAATLAAASESELAQLRWAIAAQRGGARAARSSARGPNMRPLDRPDRPGPEQIAKPDAEPEPPTALDAMAAPEVGAARREAPPQAAAVVAILEAAATQPRARPGQTIEFYTRFRVTPGLGRSDTYVIAAWVLKRNGRSLGEPGAKGTYAKAGVSTVSTRFAIPPGMSAGRYTVEHVIQSERSEVSARSQFTVASR